MYIIQHFGRLPSVLFDIPMKELVFYLCRAFSIFVRQIAIEIHFEEEAPCMTPPTLELYNHEVGLQAMH